MKRAVILHGTDAAPEQNWFPWLKQKLETEGYEVWAPLLPGNHTPNREVYNDFLLGQEQGWDFTDNIVVGHSSGAVAVLNLLMDPRCPKVKLGVMVGAWAGGTPDGSVRAIYNSPTFFRQRVLAPSALNRMLLSWRFCMVKMTHIAL